MRSLSLVITLLFIPAIQASELEQALLWYEQGDNAEAAPILERLARSGNPDAQYHLAFLYFNGDAVEQNDELAAKWFETAARQGHAAAQDTLAYMYLNGRGRKTSPVKAYAWYSLAAENGIFLASQIVNMLEQQLEVGDVMAAKILADEYRAAIIQQ